MAIVICDAVLGMRFIHWRNIIHLDLKPSNILVRDNCRALIGDFGSSFFERDEGTIPVRTGTFNYAAPELTDASCNVSGKVDVFAFGLILYEIFCDDAVFPTSLPLFTVIQRIRSEYRPSISGECGEYMKVLICRCWSQNPSSRPSFDEILRDIQAHQYKILPGVDCAAIRGAVEGVLAWESVADIFIS
jgi:serine/threonine protein kinase